MKFEKKTSGVSPVIGVILMVAIAVILAAVIAAFVFGMAGNIQKTKIVTATASRSGPNVVVTWQGGQDNFQTQNYTVTVQGATDNVFYNGTPDTSYPPAVGNSNRLGPVPTGQMYHTMVVATFLDGSQQVVLDTNI